MAIRIIQRVTLSWLLCLNVIVASNSPGAQSVLNNSPSEHRSPNIQADLGSRLSDASRLYTRDHAKFRASTARWQEMNPPTFRASVEVGNVQDIVETILYANIHGIPFMATTGKHGDMLSLTGLKEGIQIDLRDLNKVEILPDGEHALIGGGIKQGELINALAASNKRTVTGVCECVGLGLALGSGHGFLQGQYGLMADQIVEWHLILANGTQITVSKDSHPDLFWAMNGAGFNFGVVTSIKMKIYPLDSHAEWIMETFTFTSPQLEAVYATANTLSQTQRSEDVHMSFWAHDPTTNELLIHYTILHDVHPDDLTDDRYATALRALHPLSSSVSPIAYTAMPALFYSSMSDPACARADGTLLRFPVDFTTFNTTAMRRVYDLTATLIASEPAFAATLVAVEAYPVQRVQAVDPDSTAFPWRGDRLLVSPFVTYASDPRLDGRAVAFGQEFRRVLQEGTGRGMGEVHAYVNYARGDEGEGAWYGYEEWRREKLRRVKRAYDPGGSFSWFAQIEVGGEEVQGVTVVREHGGEREKGKSEL